MADTPALELSQVAIRGAEITSDRHGGVTIALGDGLTLRLLPDGTVRLRAANHQLRVAWLTNKPDAGDRSVLGLELTRKD